MINENVFKYLRVSAFMQCAHFLSIFKLYIYVFTHASVQEFGAMLHINDAIVYFITANTAHAQHILSFQANESEDASQLQTTYRSIYASIINGRSIDQTIDRFGQCGADVYALIDGLFMNGFNGEYTKLKSIEIDHLFAV